MGGIIRFTLAVLFIGLGVLLVLGNVGIADIGLRVFWHHLYPVLILAIGLKWLFDFFRRRGHHWFLGLFFTVFGGLLLLDRFEILTFYFRDVFKLWPLLIIYIGFQLLGFDGKWRRSSWYIRDDEHVRDSDYQRLSDVKTENFAIGSQDYSEPNWQVEPMNINTLVGDFYLDLTKAFIPEKEIPISIRSLAGDVHILMPEQVEFRIEAYVKAGDIEVLSNNRTGIGASYLFETENYKNAERKIDFFVKLQAGSIRVDQV